MSSSTNFKGDPLSDQKIAEYALDLRRFHGLSDFDVPEIGALLERDTILTRFGEKSFDYQIVNDTDLGGDEAITLITQFSVRVRLSRSIYERALSLDRRARFSVAHEFAHGTLHRNSAPLARGREMTVSRVIPAHVSVERQADVFASAYLVTEAMMSCATSPSDLADRYLISPAAADVRWEKEQKRLNRDVVGSGLKALHAELRVANKVVEKGAEDTVQCPVCGHRTLIAIGVKYLCTGPCDRVYDSFPDGDSPTV